MMSTSSSLKRAYDAVALVAVLNVLALVALGALLVWSGAVNSEKLRFIANVLRGDEGSLPESEAIPVASPDATQGAAPKASAVVAAESQADAEIVRLEADRIKAELDQRLALNNSILLRVMAQREQFQREQEEAAQRQEKSLEERRNSGFQKQIAIYEALNPKVALEHLLAVDDPDEAARILLEMNTRKAKKIIEAGKRGDQMSRMKAILKRLRDVAPDRSDELEGNEP